MVDELSKARAGRVRPVKHRAPLGVSHFSPTLQQLLMIAALCIDLLYSCACHAENAHETNAVFLVDITILIIIIVIIVSLGAPVLHNNPTLVLKVETDIFTSALSSDALMLTKGQIVFSPHLHISLFYSVILHRVKYFNPSNYLCRVLFVQSFLYVRYVDILLYNILNKVFFAEFAPTVHI